MGVVGIWETLVLMPFVLLFAPAPIIVAVWVIVRLRQIQSGQDALREKLTAIESLLQRHA